ncbi:MAG: thioredoxin-dependent thiol peroxidase [Flavobacteriales bacterium]|nr:thioredoxin-dependent thiol peroxidase [Flavobacteriales bacterium]
MLQKGDKVPNIEVVDQDNNSLNLVNFKGKKVVLFFYPKASTPGCTAEACNLNDNIERFQSLNYQVIGISADSVKRQKSFHEKYGFNYPLIADENKELINYFGVWGKKKFMGKEYEGIIRTTFIINEEGVIDDVITDVKTKAHTDQIL